MCVLPMLYVSLGLVSNLRLPIPEPALETWRSKVVVDSASATALESAMARTLLDALSETV